MDRSWQIGFIVFAAFAAGCDSSSEQPPPLPALTSPLPGPPKPYEPKVISSHLDVRDSDGIAITEAATSETIHLELTFKLDNTETPVRQVILRMGLERDDGFLIMNETGVQPERDDDGIYHAKAELKCPPVARDFLLRVQIPECVLIELPFIVVENEE